MYLNSRAKGAYRRLKFTKALAAIPVRRNGEKKRLAIITGELEVGGVGRVLLNIIDSLPKEKFEVYIFTTDPRINNWAPEFQKRVHLVIDIPPTIGRSLPQKYVNSYLKRYLSRQRFDVIFITNSLSGYEVLPSIKSKGKSKDVKIYDLLHTHGRPEDDDAFLKISMPFDKYIDRRIVISNYLKKYYCLKYNVAPGKVSVIYNGLSREVLRAKPNKANGKKFLGLNNGERAIAYLGRLQEDKSPERLVELANKARHYLETKRAFIAVVGEGPMQASLVDKSREYGILEKQIKFFPFTKDPLDVCAASYLTILTSDLEGIPMVALESMYVETPMIAFDVGGVPEIIDDNQDGFLVSWAAASEERRITNLSERLYDALNMADSSKMAMNKAAKKKITNRFSKMGNEYLKLFVGK